MPKEIPLATTIPSLIQTHHANTINNNPLEHGLQIGGILNTTYNNSINDYGTTHP